VKPNTLVLRLPLSEPTGFFVADKWNPGTGSDKFFVASMKYAVFPKCITCQDFGYTTLVGCKIDLPFHRIIRDYGGGGVLFVEPECLLRKKIYLKADTDVFR
jgi:hypothetical protein